MNVNDHSITLGSKSSWLVVSDRQEWKFHLLEPLISQKRDPTETENILRLALPQYILITVIIITDF